MKFLYLCLFLAFSSLFSEEIFLFSPPDSFQCSDPSQLSKHILIGYLGKSNNFFSPSINIAKEKVDVDLKGYVHAVKKIHQDDPKTTIRELGVISTLSGKACLLEITTSSKIGELQMLQALLVKEGWAYILTAATLKKEFSHHYKEFYQAIRSIRIVPDLFSPIEDANKELFLKSKIEALRQHILEKNLLSNQKQLTEKMEEFHSYLIKEFNSLGHYWHLLVLKEVLADLKKN